MIFTQILVISHRQIHVAQHADIKYCFFKLRHVNISPVQGSSKFCEVERNSSKFQFIEIDVDIHRKVTGPGVIGR